MKALVVGTNALVERNDVISNNMANMPWAGNSTIVPSLKGVKCKCWVGVCRCVCRLDGVMFVLLPAIFDTFSLDTS